MYAPDATAAAVPLREIAGPKTGFGMPIQIAMDELELISPSKGLRFAKGAVGNVAPKGFFYGWNALAVAPRVSD